MLVGAYTQGIEMQVKLEEMGLNVIVNTHQTFIKIQLILDYVNATEFAEYLQVIAQHYEVDVADLKWAMEPFDADNIVMSVVVS